MISALLLASLCSSAPSDWPTWRGPDGSGFAAGPAPTEWSDEENVAWRVPIEGRGVSTPVVWGERMFLTTAVASGAGKTGDSEDTEAEFHGGGGAQEEQDFVVLCLDRASGKTLWRTPVHRATPHEGFHKTYGSFASSSPVVEENRLWVSFGSFGLYCLDHEGKVLWETDPGVKMEMRRQFGEGATPVVHGRYLIQGFDHEGDSFVAVFDKNTGEELWRKERDEPSVWSQPLIVEDEGGPLAVLSGVNRVRAYRLESGDIQWECGGLGLNPIPAPLRIGDQVIVMSGYRDANILSIRLGGEGDLTDTDHVVWQSPKGPSYTASPVLANGKLYCARDRGFLSCFDARTGEAHYVETRLPRGSTLKSSPLAAGEHLYVPTEEGDVHLIALGEEYRHVRTNTLEDQVFIASPILVGGDLYLRSLSELICVRSGG